MKKKEFEPECPDCQNELKKKKHLTPHERQFQRQANATITRIERKLGKLERTGYPLADRLAALKAFVSTYARCSNCQRESGHESWCPYRRDDGSDAYAIMREARAVLSGRPWHRKK